MLQKLNSPLLILVASFLGIISGYVDVEVVHRLAVGVSELFIRLLRLVSLPIIFLSITTTFCGMESLEAARSWGRRVLKYTLLTTVIAATVALGLFLLLDPVAQGVHAAKEIGLHEIPETKGYLSYLQSIVPENLVQPFYQNEVLGVLFLASVLGVAALTLPDENRKPLHGLFSSLFAAVMRITQGVLLLMPLAVWAFVTIFAKEMRSGLPMKGIMIYLFCIVAANLIQAFVVLPLLLAWRGISPKGLFQAMHPALTVAFFSKSSSAALPVAMQCGEERAGFNGEVSRFAFPLCVTINMNACAAFILITVLFISGIHGLTFSGWELGSWVFIATLAAVGNAGVPMGCYFLSSALLAAMDVPLHILGLIYPIYGLIDMLESAINVWSDSCVTAAVNREIALEEQAGEGVQSLSV